MFGLTARGGTINDAAKVSSRRYVVALANPTWVNEATRQYVMRKRARARLVPGGWKKAATRRKSTIAAQTITPMRPCSKYATSQLLSIGRPLTVALERPKPKISWNLVRARF